MFKYFSQFTYLTRCILMLLVLKYTRVSVNVTGTNNIISLKIKFLTIFRKYAKI